VTHPEEAAVISAAVAFVEARAAQRWDVPAKLALVRAVDALVLAREGEEPCERCDEPESSCQCRCGYCGSKDCADEAHEHAGDGEEGGGATVGWANPSLGNGG